MPYQTSGCSHDRINAKMIVRTFDTLPGWIVRDELGALSRPGPSLFVQVHTLVVQLGHGFQASVAHEAILFIIKRLVIVCERELDYNVNWGGSCFGIPVDKRLVNAATTWFRLLGIEGEDVRYYLVGLGREEKLSFAFDVSVRTGRLVDETFGQTARPAVKGNESHSLWTRLTIDQFESNAGQLWNKKKNFLISMFSIKI